MHCESLKQEKIDLQQMLALDKLSQIEEQNNESHDQQQLTKDLHSQLQII